MKKDTMTEKQGEKIYKKGDFVTATRSGSNETIQGNIVKIWKDYIWGHFLAEVKTIKGDIRLITTETDFII